MKRLLLSASVLMTLLMVALHAQDVAGTWQGTLQVTTPQGKQVSLPIVLRFETDKTGQYVGFIDSPQQHAAGIPVTDASLAAGKLVAKARSSERFK